MLVKTVNFPFVATENRTPWWLAGAALRSTMLTTSTATGCGSISTGCGPRRKNGVRTSPREPQPRSVPARLGQDSSRFAPGFQPKTPGHQRENVRGARDLSSRSVRFSLAKSVQFSVAIDW